MSTLTPPKTLMLAHLNDGLPGVTPALGRVHYEACLVCLSGQGHVYGVQMKMQIDNKEELDYQLVWDNNVSAQVSRAYGDEEVATEYAAYGIAFLLMLNLTKFTVVRKSQRGTGIDYWLGEWNEEEVRFQEYVQPQNGV